MGGAPTEKLYCNCAVCGVEMVGLSTAHLAENGEVVMAGRVNDRPQCQYCYGSSKPWNLTKELLAEMQKEPCKPKRHKDILDGDESPWQSNVIRELEDPG